MFLYEISLPPEVQQEFIYRGGVVPDNVVNRIALPTLLTSMFLHGGWMHLIGNMVFLWVFGVNLEATLGRIPYLIFYLMVALLLAEPISSRMRRVIFPVWEPAGRLLLYTTR